MSLKYSVSRFAIVAFAETQVYFGAHYLRGADGAQPDCRDGLEGRNVTLREDTSSKNFAVHAAMLSNRACRGRYEKVGGRPLTEKSDLNKLEEYRLNLAAGNLSPAQYPAFDKGLFPRRDPTNTGIYLGEDCRAKRHFDCESFMAWCISYALNDHWTEWKYGVQVYNAGLKGRLDVTPRGAGFPKKSQLLNGDILIRITDKGEHMAFVTDNGSKVLEASEAARGILASPYTEERWTAHARIKESYL